MKELRPIEESWNKKRIIIGLLFIFVAIAGLTALKVMVLDQNQNSPQDSVVENTRDVKGASVDAGSRGQNNPAVDLKANIQDQLNVIKQEASNINLAEVASSSPQVQKVIDDIKSIQNLPRDKAKGFCEQICGGL